MNYTVVDPNGFRLSVGIVLANADNKLFWARRVGKDVWQFPQGGVGENETTKEALLRELGEEVGLLVEDVKIIGESRSWVKYLLPQKYIRNHKKPLVLGQKQKWYLLRLLCDDKKIKLNTSNYPEFDNWVWADYWEPIKNVVFFKQEIYQQILDEFECILLGEQTK